MTNANDIIQNNKNKINFNLINDEQAIDFSKKMIFLDLEATDSKPFEILQVGFYDVSYTNDMKENVHNEFNHKYKSNAKVAKRIKLLLDFDKNFKDWNTLNIFGVDDLKNIISLLQNKIVVCFGDLDYMLLNQYMDKYNLKYNNTSFFDFHHFLKRDFNKKPPSLFSLSLILNIKSDIKKTHNALYDAWLLKEVVVKYLQKRKDSQFLEYCLNARKLTPKIRHDYFEIPSNDTLWKQSNRQTKQYMIIQDIEFQNTNEGILKFKYFLIKKDNNYQKWIKEPFECDINDKTKKSEIKRQVIHIVSDMLKSANFAIIKKVKEDQIIRLSRIYNRIFKKAICIKYLSIENKQKKLFEINKIILQMKEIAKNNESMRMFLKEYIE